MATDRYAPPARRARPERRGRACHVPRHAARPRRGRADVAHAARRQDRLHHQRPGARGRAGGDRLADAPGHRLDGALLPLDRVSPHVRDERRGHHHRPPRQGRRRQLRRPADARPLRWRAVQHRLAVVPGRDAGAPRGRDRHGRVGSWRQRRRPDQLRRGHGQPGRDPRGDELRRRPQPAGHLRLREQRLRDQRPARPPGRRWLGRGPRGGLRDAGRRRRRRRRPRAATRRPRRPTTEPCAARARR